MLLMHFSCILVEMTLKFVPSIPINSLAFGRSEWDSKNVIFNLVLLVDIARSSHDNAL